MRGGSTPTSSCPSRRRRRTAPATVAAVAALAAALATPGAAQAAPPGRSAATVSRAAAVTALPAGWSVTGGALTWTSTVPVPVGGARLDVVADGEVRGEGRLGTDRRTVSTTVAAGAVKDLSSLQVVAAGRRLDAGPVSLAVAAARSRTSQAASQATPQATPQAVAKPAALPTLPALPAAVDPGRRGPYPTRTGEYALPDLPVTRLAVPVEMKAVVVAPVGAPGRRPLALFLHGRHEACYLPDGVDPGEPQALWPCPPGWKQVPSYRGYLQTQRLLASQGWLTVSVSANGVNAQDTTEGDDGGALARSELVRAHLARWAGWAASDDAWAAAPAAVRAGPRPRLSTVLLVGHSRGGEGVNRAAIDSAADGETRWRVKGQLLLAPTAFGRNPAPGVPTAVVLPYCDGDVFDLQGQSYLDDARDLAKDRSLRSAVLVLGANHNFFNSEWTPGASVAPSRDDWFDDTDPTCGTRAPNRLTPAQQRAVGATYVAAAARVLVGRDARVEPLLDGSPVRAASAGRAVVRSHALGARRNGLLTPGTGTRLTRTGTLAARLCATEVLADPARACVAGDDSGSPPHFPFDVFGQPGAPVRQVLAVRWSRAGGSARLRLPEAESVVHADALALRVVAPPRAGAARFGVRLLDADGTRWVAGTGSVTGLPGNLAGVMAGKYWAQEVRVRLDRRRAAAAGLDLTRVVGVEILPLSARGRIWVLDAWGRDPGLAPAATVPFVRVDVGRLAVTEGDSGTRRVSLPLTVSGTLRSSARVFLAGPEAASVRGVALPAVVRIPAGARRVVVRVPVTGNTLDDEDLTLLQVSARGVRNAVAGDWVGGLTVADDDPTPAVTITPLDATAREGTALAWTISLAAPSNRAIVVPLLVQPVVPPGRELDTDDLTLEFLQQRLFVDARPVPPVPLSQVGLFLDAFLEPGLTSTTVEIPTAADSRAEGAEQVRLRVPAPGEDFPDEPGVPGLPAGADLTGTVTD